MDVLEVHARGLRGVGVAFADTGERVYSTWQGLRAVYAAPEAEELFAAMGPVQQVSASVGEDIETVGRVLEGYASEVRDIQVRLDRLRAEAVEIEESAVLFGIPDAIEHAVTGEDPMDSVLAWVAVAMADFEDAQRRCANAIRALTAGPAVPADGDGVVEAGEFGSTPTSAAGMAAWWASLSPAQQEQVRRGRPEWIGGVDGIPAKDRDVANRAMLGAEATRLDAEIGMAQAQLDEIGARDEAGLPWGWSPKDEALSAGTAVLAGLQKRRAAVTEAEKVVAREDRQLLVLDLSGEPNAVVAIGDVDTADHVAVFTPGLDSTVERSLDGYDRDMDGVRKAAVNQLDRVERGGESVAAVTWIGYDPPQLAGTLDPGLSVLGSGVAQDGGVKLASFLDGIVASRDTDPHLTALGHSYGSTTTGYALQSASGVDDAVVFGSPGLGTSDVHDLNVPPGHVGVIEAHTDLIADGEWFGRDPNRLDGVVNLDTAGRILPDGRVLAESLGHEEYLVPGTTSQNNIAVSVAGMPENLAETTRAASSEPYEEERDSWLHD